MLCVGVDLYADYISVHLPLLDEQPPLDGTQLMSSSPSERRWPNEVRHYIAIERRQQLRNDLSGENLRNCAKVVLIGRLVLQ